MPVATKKSTHIHNPLNSEGASSLQWFEIYPIKFSPHYLKVLCIQADICVYIYIYTYTDIHASTIIDVITCVITCTCVFTNEQKPTSPK